MPRGLVPTLLTFVVAASPLMRRHGDVLQSGGASYYDLLVVIPSNVKSVEKRQSIRESWAKYLDAAGRCARCNSTRTVKILFGVGKADEADATGLELEQRAFGDVATLAEVGASQDYYRNLTAKVRSCIDFAVQNFRFSLLLKVDTDSYVFLDRLLALLEAKKLFQEDAQDHGIYAGAFQTNARPDENPAGKWADLTYRLLTGHELFPKYARGAGYLLSPSLCRYIAGSLGPRHDHGAVESWAGLPHLQPLPNEDVSVGFWLEPVVHRKVELPVAHLPTGCRNQTQVIDHHVMPKLMSLRWTALETVGDPCGTKAVLDEEVFEQLLTMRLDALNYSGLV